jgi:hypothetical protein
MPNIGEIEISADLAKLFELPACNDISLPKPQKLEITLPTGGSLKAITDASKAIPNDCSLVASLLIQLAPFLASIDCLFKLLGLVGPLIDVVKGVGPPPDPIKLGKAIPKFIEAAEKVIPCVLVVTGAPLIPFLRDILCLILKILGCIIQSLDSLIGIMSGLTLRITEAKAGGNTALLKALECAQGNAATAAQHMANSIDAVAVILELSGSLMGLAGLPQVQLPKLGSQSDIESLKKAVTALKDAKKVIQEVVDLPIVGGCPA